MSKITSPLTYPLKQLFKRAIDFFSGVISFIMQVWTFLPIVVTIIATIFVISMFLQNKPIDCNSGEYPPADLGWRSIFISSGFIENHVFFPTIAPKNPIPNDLSNYDAWHRNSRDQQRGIIPLPEQRTDWQFTGFQLTGYPILMRVNKSWAIAYNGQQIERGNNDPTKHFSYDDEIGFCKDFLEGTQTDGRKRIGYDRQENALEGVTASHMDAKEYNDFLESKRDCLLGKAYGLYLLILDEAGMEKVNQSRAQCLLEARGGSTQVAEKKAQINETCLKQLENYGQQSQSGAQPQPDSGPQSGLVDPGTLEQCKENLHAIAPPTTVTEASCEGLKSYIRYSRYSDGYVYHVGYHNASYKNQKTGATGEHGEYYLLDLEKKIAGLKGEIISGKKFYVYMKIMDSFHNDNTEGYQVKFLKGVMEVDELLIDGWMNSYDRMLKNAYELIVKIILFSPGFVIFVKWMAYLSFLVYAFYYLLGFAERENWSKFIIRMIKIGLILQLTMGEASWEFLSRYFLDIFIGARNLIYANIGSFLYGEVTLGESRPYIAIDAALVKVLFSMEMFKRMLNFVILSPILGIIVVLPVTIITVLFFLMVILRMVIIVALSTFIVALVISLSPIMLAFIVFDVRYLKNKADAVIELLSVHILMPAMVFGVIVLATGFVMDQFHKVFGTRVCSSGPLLNIDLGPINALFEIFNPKRPAIRPTINSAGEYGPLLTEFPSFQEPPVVKDGFMITQTRVADAPYLNPDNKYDMTFLNSMMTERNFLLGFDVAFYVIVTLIITLIFVYIIHEFLNFIPGIMSRLVDRTYKTRGRAASASITAMMGRDGRPGAFGNILSPMGGKGLVPGLSSLATGVRRKALDLAKYKTLRSREGDVLYDEYGNVRKIDRGKGHMMRNLRRADKIESLARQGRLGDEASKMLGRKVDEAGYKAKASKVFGGGVIAGMGHRQGMLDPSKSFDQQQHESRRALRLMDGDIKMAERADINLFSMHSKDSAGARDEINGVFGELSKGERNEEGRTAIQNLMEWGRENDSGRFDSIMTKLNPENRQEFEGGRMSIDAAGQAREETSHAKPSVGPSPTQQLEQQTRVEADKQGLELEKQRLQQRQQREQQEAQIKGAKEAAEAKTKTDAEAKTKTEEARKKETETKQKEKEAKEKEEETKQIEKAAKEKTAAEKLDRNEKLDKQIDKHKQAQQKLRSELIVGAPDYNKKLNEMTALESEIKEARDKKE